MTLRLDHAPCAVLLFALAAGATTGSAGAAPPPHLDALRQEMAVAEDVFQAALGNAPGVRVWDVEADYLAAQGVLLSMAVRKGWFGTGRARVVKIVQDTEIGVPIPDMVHEILADLDIPGLAHRAPDFEVLNELREQQRALRNQQRKVRHRVWQTRLEIATGQDEEEGADTVVALEAESERLDAERKALESRIDAEYQRLSASGTGGQVETPAGQDASGPVPDADLEALLLQAVCDYGGTLKSLPEDEHLSLRVRESTRDVFYVFRFEDVVDCQRGSMTPAKLLEAGVSYEG